MKTIFGYRLRALTLTLCSYWHIKGIVCLMLILGTSSQYQNSCLDPAALCSIWCCISWIQVVFSADDINAGEIDDVVNVLSIQHDWLIMLFWWEIDNESNNVTARDDDISASSVLDSHLRWRWSSLLMSCWNHSFVTYHWRSLAIHWNQTQHETNENICFPDYTCNKYFIYIYSLIYKTVKSHPNKKDNTL